MRFPSDRCVPATARVHVGRERAYTTTRAAPPTIADLERALGALEGALPAVCCATGSTALSVLLLATVQSGDTVVCTQVNSGGTVRLLDPIVEKLGVTACYIDTSDHAALEAALVLRPALCLVESRTDPPLQLTDLAERCQGHRVRLAVDNTLPTPTLQRPLAWGADVVLYRTTQSLEGHNAPVSGAILTRDADLLAAIRFVRNALRRT